MNQKQLCANCNSEVSPEEKYCLNCGRAIKNGCAPDQQKPSKSKSSDKNVITEISPNLWRVELDWAMGELLQSTQHYLSANNENEAWELFCCCLENHAENTLWRHAKENPPFHSLDISSGFCVVAIISHDGKRKYLVKGWFKHIEKNQLEELIASENFWKRAKKVTITNLNVIKFTS